MSDVTDVILTTSLLEEPGESGVYPAVEWLNAWLLEHGHFPLVRVDGYSRGAKRMQARVFIGAFNHFDLDEFIAAVQRAPWKDEDGVALFVQQEQAERLTDVTPKIERPYWPPT